MNSSDPKLDFDVYDDILYNTITKIFYNKYPYKVNITHPFPIPDMPDIRYGEKLTKEDNRKLQICLDFRTSKNEFYEKYRKFCFKNMTGDWISRNNGVAQTFCFFFKEEKDAKTFIKKSYADIICVYRPENENQIRTLASNKKLELRDMLYWGRYRYGIEFKYMSEPENDLDNTIREIFPKKNIRRYSYIYGKKRRLYLNKKSDLLYVFMSLSEKIEKQFEAILKSEITNEH